MSLQATLIRGWLGGASEHIFQLLFRQSFFWKIQLKMTKPEAIPPDGIKIRDAVLHKNIQKTLHHEMKICVNPETL